MKTTKRMTDEYALVTILIRRLEQYRKELGSQLKEVANPIVPFLTSNFCVTYKCTDVERIDVESIRIAMGETWLNQHKRLDTREELSIASLTGIDKKIKQMEIKSGLIEKLVKEFLNEKSTNLRRKV